VTEDWTPQNRLRAARQREEVVSAIVAGLSDWRRMLEVVESCVSEEEARDSLCRTFGLSPVQARAVMDTQFRRLTAMDRERIAAELVELHREIQELEGQV
jgi:DNA gyrase subunit A